MTDRTAPVSILSHGEQAIAARLAADPDATPAEIAEARNESEKTVTKAIDRIRTKTRRAFTTLEQSPFTEEVARELDPEIRGQLVETLREADRTLKRNEHENETE